MKKVLSLLVAFVFMQAQTWALSGGPVYGGQASSTVSGAYAGTLVPLSATEVDAGGAFVPVTATSGVNALGIFVMDVPTEGLATGTFLFFRAGEAFFGDIQGVIDPATLQLSALVTGAASTNTGGGEFLTPFAVVGDLLAEVVVNNRSINNVRLEGEAHLQMLAFVPDASPNGFGFGVVQELTFAVDGFKQSDETAGAAITPPNTTSIPAPVPAP
jgi:hypothetical protein